MERMRSSFCLHVVLPWLQGYLFGRSKGPKVSYGFRLAGFSSIRYSKAEMPVMSRPRIRVWMSCVPS
jgi:hypothetical protein